MRSNATPGRRDPLAAALIELATEVDDPVVKQWLDAMGRFGEGFAWSADEVPPPPRPAAKKRIRKVGD
jgi:hypothetical protein